MQTAQTKHRGDGKATAAQMAPAHIELLKMAMPAEPKFVAFARRAVGGVLHQLRMGKDTSDDIVLAVGEACNNAVLYAGQSKGQSVSLVCRVMKPTSRSQSLLQIDIRNHGNGFARMIDESSYTMPLAEHMGEHGRGLPLMQAFLDRVEVFSDGSDTVVRLEKMLN